MYFRRKTSAGRAYLQIVESRRDGDQVRQQVIATLGRFEELQASGQLERLVRSGARFAAKAMVLSAASNDAAIKIAVRRIGPALVFERLWEETGCRAVITELAGKRKHGFALERAVFLTVLHRLFVSGSDRAADRWREDYAIAGVEGLDLHHLYRAMAWLGEELPEKEQDGRTPFAPRCLKDVVEERLFAHRRDLLTRLDLVFMDTTSLYFEGAGGQTLGQHGYSKDHRPDLRQMILRRPDRRRRAAGVLGDVARQHRRRDDVDPGDRPAAPALRHRARVRGRRSRHDQRRDHGGARGTATVVHPGCARALEQAGARAGARRSGAVRATADEEARQGDRLRGQDGDAGRRRYIVCRNRQEAEKDAADRASIVAALERQLAKGDKALVGNTAFGAISRRSARSTLRSTPTRSRRRRSSTASSCSAPTPISIRSRPCSATSSFGRWSRPFEQQSICSPPRPIFHKLDETICGHVFCSFLALVLKKALEDRIAALGHSGSWPEIIADLDSLTETEIEYDGKRFIVRSAPRPAASLALRAAGAALPPTVRDAAAS